jgi:FkbM family methyltransferase
MTVFDIGANAGHHMILLSRLCGASGHVHAFEPVPENVACLLETVRLNGLRNVTVHPLAISDREGGAELKFSGVFDGFACLTQGDHGRSECQRAPRISITVRTSDLDTICSKSGIARVDLIKMDIEGAEMLALQGMTRTLRRDRPILIMELWGTEHLSEAPRFLRRLGYEIQTLSLW